MDFSQALPSFLSCGSADGTVCVYNVKEVENVAILDSSNNAARGHVSPVWQVSRNVLSLSVIDLLKP